MIIRDAAPADAAGMAEVLNAVIAIGGTTAHENPKSDAQVRKSYITDADVLSSFVAEDQGRILGWQSVGIWQDEPHIGTFVLPGLQARGIGRELFAATRNHLRAKRARFLIAHIRADNIPGLAFYARIGFRDIGGDPGFALSDGRIVGRIHRRFDL